MQVRAASSGVRSLLVMARDIVRRDKTVVGDEIKSAVTQELNHDRAAVPRLERPLPRLVGAQPIDNDALVVIAGRHPVDQ